MRHPSSLSIVTTPPWDGHPGGGTGRLFAAERLHNLPKEFRGIGIHIEDDVIVSGLHSPRFGVTTYDSVILSLFVCWSQIKDKGLKS